MALSDIIAAQRRFDSLMDLVSAVDDGPFLRALPPDSRAPLSFAALHGLMRSLRASVALVCGSRLAAALPNGPELAACFLVVSSMGVSFAPINTDLLEDEAAFVLRDMPASALVVQGGKSCAASIMSAAAREGTSVIQLLPDAATCGAFTLAGRIPQADGVQHTAASGVSREWVALVLHTSGTTRQPKLVPLTHHQLGVGALCVASTLELDRRDVALNAMPLFHLHGLAVNILASAVAGASVSCAPHFDAASFLGGARVSAAGLSSEETDSDESVAADRREWYSAVPSIHLELVRQAERDSLAGTPPICPFRLARNCSAALAPSIAERL